MALRVDTMVAVPSGWATVRELSAGDHLFDQNGKVTDVIAVGDPELCPDVWRVTFSDDATVDASGDHEWTVEELTRHYRAVAVDTSTMSRRVVTRRDGARNYRIPLAAPLKLPHVAVPLDPYVLGVWLGDGERGAARITTVDGEIVEGLRSAGFEVWPSGRLRYSIRGLAALLRQAGVLDDKHVPPPYLRASYAQRLALVQGLMDTDGTCALDTRACEYVSTNRRLADGVAELLATLGIKATVREGTAKLGGRSIGPKWRIRFTVHDDRPVFRLPRKLSRLRPAGSIRRLHATRQVIAVERIADFETRRIHTARACPVLAGPKMVPVHA